MKLTKIIACSLILTISAAGGAFAAPHGAPADKGTPQMKAHPAKTVTTQQNRDLGRQAHNPQFNKNVKPGQPQFGKHDNRNIKPGHTGHNDKYANPGKVHPVYQKNVYKNQPVYYNGGHAPVVHHTYSHPTYVVRENNDNGAEKFIAGALIGAVVTTIINNSANNNQ